MSGNRSDIPKAIHSGSLNIGETKIPCYVLDNTDRILATSGVLKSLGRSKRGRRGLADREKKGIETQTPVFLEAHNLKRYINKHLEPRPKPVVFRTVRGHLAEGYKAELLPSICDVYLDAREDGVLTIHQKAIARKCETLVRGFARVGIIALVDEATGYQEIRDRAALKEILDKYLLAEHAKWARRFPDEFYQEIFRLRGWQWQGMKVNRPQVVAHYTNDIVWDRLAPGVREKLEHLNPPIKTGVRVAKHHQYLTEDVGHPALQRHLDGVTVLMKSVSYSNPERAWKEFKRRLQRVYPKVNANLELDLGDN